MTKWNNLTPDTATAADIITAGKRYGIKEEERCDLSDLLHGVPQSVLFEMLDRDEHTALFLMSGSSMPTTTMIEVYNAHAGMKSRRSGTTMKARSRPFAIRSTPSKRAATTQNTRPRSQTTAFWPPNRKSPF